MRQRSRTGRSRFPIRVLIAALGLGGLACGLWFYLRAPLPAYSLLLEGGQAMYLQSEAPLTMRPETRLSLTLRPATPVTRPVFVHARIEQDRRQALWPVVFEQTSRGTVRLQGTAQELLPTCSGRCVLHLYLHDAYLPPTWLAACPKLAMKLLPSVQELRAEITVTRN